VADRQIEQSAPEAGARRRRRFRWYVVAPVALLALLAALAGAAYAERLRLAAILVQRYLAAQGVRSEIEISRLDWGGVLVRVEAGPEEAPDFTADGIAIGLAWPDASLAGWLKPEIASVRLIHPVLRGPL
jgi:hypothetical protein